MALGFRPAAAETALTAPFDAAHGVNPREPQTTLEVPTVETMDAIMRLWKDNKKRSNVTLVMDVSGSMNENRRIENARFGASQLIDLLGDSDSFRLMACDFHKKSRNLMLKDILNPDFQSWMNGVESATTGMSNSTGNMMRDMVLRGPSSFDALFVYASVVIDYLKSAEGRWGELRVAYSKQNAWNDNPYYVLDTAVSPPDQRRAAAEFLDFLLSEPVQRESLKHGFRPGNTAVPIKFPESPFVLYERFGLKIDVGAISDTPRAEVINNLLASWQRGRAGN